MTQLTKNQSRIELDFPTARLLIHEGDVLLFRTKGIVSSFIKIYSEGSYSHIGLASWVKNGGLTDILECIEIREWKGGRGVNLERYLREHSGQIDIYRPIPRFSSWKFNPITNEPILLTKEFNGKLVTHTFRKLLGIEYGWRRIWWIAKRKMFILRLFCNKEHLEQNTQVDDIIYPVCSTAVTYAFQKNGYELIHNKNFDYTEPSDISRSTRLSYLFTLI